MVAEHLGSNNVRAGEGRDSDKYIMTRLNHVIPALNIVNIYGENENRAGQRKVLEPWLQLKGD